MWTRTVMFVAAASLAAAAAAAGQSSQTPSQPPTNDNCLACHGDASLKRDDGRSLAIDATVFEHSTHGPMACVDCHVDAKEVPHSEKLAKVKCASCHDDIGSKYRDSIHAWAKEKAGA